MNPCKTPRRKRHGGFKAVKILYDIIMVDVYAFIKNHRMCHPKKKNPVANDGFGVTMMC